MDINTIFYFPSSLTFEEYSNKLDRGEISERTIVFADAQKAIYKGGKKYGGTSVQEFHDLTDTLYDDSWISDDIANIKADIIEAIVRMDQFDTLVTNIGTTLNTEIENRERNIQNKVEQLMIDAQWLLDNFPLGVTQWDAGWNQNVEAYLQIVGYWTRDENDQVVTQWSKLLQQLNSVESSVNSLKVDGNLTLALTTSIHQLITDRIAQLQLGTTYATVEKVGDVETVLEWMYSGLKSSTSPDKTFTELSSMGKSGLLSAISQIRTQVESLKDGAFMATADLEAMVGDNIASLSASVDDTSSIVEGLSQTVGELETNLAGFLAKTDLDSSVAALFANSSSTKNAVTGLINTATGSFITSTQVDNKIATAKTEVLASASNNTTTAIAGLAEKTYVDNKVATASSTLTALIDNVSASLDLSVKKDSNGKIESTAVLNADQINLQGQTNFLNAIGNAITAKSLDVIGGGNATISGDVIAKSLVAGPSDAMHIVTTGNEIHFMSGNTVMGKFVTEDNGLQIYVMGPDGNLYKVNFSNWTNTQSSGTSHTYNLYKNKQVSGSTTRYEVVLQTSVYGNGDNTYYSDQSGNNLASLGTSSTTGLYMRKIGSISQAILPAASGAASGVTYCIYSVDLYKDTYYSGGTLYDGPNVYGVFKDGVHNDTHYVISSSNTAGVSASSVYTTESGQNSCSSIPNLNFGSGNRYLATISYTPTAFGSGHVTRVQGGQNSATLVTY